MRNNVMHWARHFGMAALPILFWLSTALAAADITIANAGTDNPTLLYRGRPMLSTNSPGRAASGSFHDGYSVHEAADELRLYQWYSMMVKVQGVGVYAKTYPLDFDDDRVRSYARQSRILMDFFDSLDDYVALRPQAARIVAGPGKHRVTMASTKEAVVYLHTGEYGRRIAAGERLVVDDLPLATGKVSAALLHPATGASERREATVRRGRLEIQLPAFDEDLLVHVRFESSRP